MTTSIIETLSTLDLFVFFLVLFITIGVIYGGHRKRKAETPNNQRKSSLEVLLDGRRLTLPLFIATLVSTWYGGIFGVTQMAYEYGIYNFITQGVFWYVSYLILAFFMAHKLRSSSAQTLPELAGQLFGPKSAKVASVFNLLNVLPIAYAMSIGLLIDTIFGIGIVPATLSGTGVVILYSMLGGFRAIVLSDLVQFFVMVSSVVMVFVLSITTYGGLGFLQANLPEAHFSITGGHSVATLLVWGFIALSTLVDPNFYQRVFAASSAATAKKGIIISTLIWCLFDICTTGGAMYAAATLKGADSAQAYLIYAMELLPHGLRGFFLAGILATILSTLDSYLFIASTTVVYDLLKKKQSLLLSHHISTAVIGLTAAFASFYFSGGIKDVWKTLGSYSAGCLLLPMVIGLLTPIKIKDHQFVAAAVTGAIAITIWRWLPREGLLANIDDLYLGISSTGLIILASWYSNRRTSPQ
ncbi:MAG: sodium:phosphate symporter [Zetaproteobacteria bacterium]|nr:sodium:phosphate symporter [Pseudobdellovibrionaceae bacterium]